jgi:hypothetical protein
MNNLNKIFDGIEVETKKCNQCDRHKPLAAFSFNSGAKHRRSKCKICESIQAKQRNKFKLFKAPDNHICPICKRNEQECKDKGGKKSGTWCLDHNHHTGEFRGWLCHECNRALGNFKDNPELLESAIKYLETNGQISRTTL